MNQKNFCFSSITLTNLFLFVILNNFVLYAEDLADKNLKKSRRVRKKLDPKHYSQSSPKKQHTRLLIEMTYEELLEKRLSYQKFGNKEGEVRVVEQMLKICPTTESLTQHWLELADLFFELGRSEMALMTYKNFMTYYPGHSKFEYALYRAILSSDQRIPAYDRDQSDTERLLELIELYHQKDFALYKGEIANIHTKSIVTLLQAELYVIEFYLNKGDVTVARDRYAALMDNSHFIAIQDERVRDWHGALGQKLQRTNPIVAHPETTSVPQEEIQS